MVRLVVRAKAIVAIVVVPVAVTVTTSQHEIDGGESSDNRNKPDQTFPAVEANKANDKAEDVDEEDEGHWIKQIVCERFCSG